MQFAQRRAVEEQWRRRLLETKVHLDSAQALVNALEYTKGDQPSPDCEFAYQHALKMQSLALDEYRRVLRVFCGLVLESKAPDEETSQDNTGCA